MKKNATTIDSAAGRPAAGRREFCAVSDHGPRRRLVGQSAGRRDGPGKGTTKGTSTDANGSYTVQAAETQILAFSYLGYTSVEEPVGRRTVINVKMAEEATSISTVEVVSVGYGTVARRDLTGSVAKADMGTIMKSNVTNFDQALGGRIAGVVVTTGDGALGAEANVVIRGNNSLTQSSAPLYIIDGFPHRELHGGHDQPQ